MTSTGEESFHTDTALAAGAAAPVNLSASVPSFAVSFRSMDGLPHFPSFAAMPFMPIGQGTLLNPQGYPMNPGAIMLGARMMQDPGSPKFSMAMSAGGRFFGCKTPLFGLDSTGPYNKCKSPRHRRSFKELVRDVHCPHENCGRRYATRSSLTTHIRLKHGGDMSLLEAQDLKEKAEMELRKAEATEAKSEGQDENNETKRDKSGSGDTKGRVRAVKDECRPRAYSSGAQLQTPTEDEVTAGLQLFDILSVDDLALLHESDRSLDDILELTPHNSLERDTQLDMRTAAPSPPAASDPSTRTHSPNPSPQTIPKHKPIAPNIGPGAMIPIMHAMVPGHQVSPLVMHGYQQQALQAALLAGQGGNQSPNLALFAAPSDPFTGPPGGIPSFAQARGMTSLESCLSMPVASIITPGTTPTVKAEEDEVLAVSGILDELEALYGNLL